MNTLDLLVICLAVYGIAHIIKTGSILQPFRDYIMSKSKTNKVALFFVNLISCYVCLGAEIGLILGFMYGPLTGFGYILNPFFYASTTIIIHSIVMFLGAGYDPNRIVTVIDSSNDK